MKLFYVLLLILMSFRLHAVSSCQFEMNYSSTIPGTDGAGDVTTYYTLAYATSIHDSSEPPILPIIKTGQQKICKKTSCKLIVTLKNTKKVIGSKVFDYIYDKTSKSNKPTDLSETNLFEMWSEDVGSGEFLFTFKSSSSTKPYCTFKVSIGLKK
ncbi:MAG: hypothetical protein ISR65_11310 [Bacteriovoracaceae bacterium]|nr:hypothetical protein [Bacteriovoracaceae bacterium]